MREVRKDGMDGSFASFAYLSIHLLNNHTLNTCHVLGLKVQREIRYHPGSQGVQSLGWAGSGVLEPVLTHLQEMLVKFSGIL